MYYLKETQVLPSKKRSLTVRIRQELKFLTQRIINVRQ